MTKQKKPKGGPLPQTPGVDPFQTTMANSGGSPVATPDQVTPNPRGKSALDSISGPDVGDIALSVLPGGVGLNVARHLAGAKVGPGTGAASDNSVGGGKSYDPDEMIRTYLPGLTPEQQGFVRAQLRASEKGSGADYHKALNDLVSGHPELSQFTPWSKLFPTQQQAGQLNPEVMGRLLQLTQQYQKPFLDQLNVISSGVSGSLQKLLPSLPSSYKGLIQAEIPVYENLGKQLGAALSAADPGQIASSYAQYQNNPTAVSQGTANSLYTNNVVPGASSDRALKANIQPVVW